MDKSTIFQQLNTIFTDFPVDSTIQNTTEKELITASSREELELKKLEYQQNIYIQQQYTQVAKDSDYKQIQAQTLRTPACFDYILMESYPIIFQALNVLSEESTPNGENGKMLTVFSDNKRIKGELENLFYNILDVNTSLSYWCRNMVKYGDTFLFLLTQKGRGIVSVRQLPTLEIIREEGVDITSKVMQTKFVWREKGESFTPWQVAHFRLLLDDRFLPYGTSVLSSIRTWWRMLRMSEDAMLVYRAARASERRVIKVNVGNADPTDVAMLVQQAASRFKKSTLVNPDGSINYKFNPATVEQDIFIAVRSDNAANPIDTLNGASNLDQISDITYLRDGLFTGLGIPKWMLAYSGDGPSEGGGKNMAQLDVRFARKINKIQQSLIQELNKMALIHLKLLGYADDEIMNFKIGLANPSTQSELLKTEHWVQKVDLYSKLTAPNEKGIAPMSETKAKQEVLGMSNDEIVEDLQRQYIENVVGDQLKNAILGIKNSKLFDELIKYYNAGIVDLNTVNQAQGGAEGGQGSEPGASEPPTGGAETQPPTPEPSGTIQEQFIKKNNTLNDDLVNLLNEMENNIDKDLIL